MLRKRLGGGWRQAGLLAAACRTPLITTWPGWSMIMPPLGPSPRRWPSGPPAAVDLAGVETNIVIIDTGDHPAAPIAAAAAEQGVAVSALGPG